MKTIIIALFVVSVLAQGEDCVKQKCPNEYNACVSEVFGCATKALDCKNKCGETDPCYKNCAYASGNKKLIALYECGQKYCNNAMYWNQVLSGCNIEKCVADFQSECISNVNQSSIQCLMGFAQSHPECDCLNE